MADRLIVTNGDSATERLRAAGIAAELLAWRDILHDGPVPGGLDLGALSQVRGRYLAEESGRPCAQVSDDFNQRDAAIRNHARHDRIELWLEHDLVDQLQLIQLLDFFASDERTDIRLVQANDYLGTQPPETLRALEETATCVTDEQFDLAGRAWTAFTAPTPEAIGALAFADQPALPYLAPALQRLLQELPAQANGLGLTEERILTALAEGPRKVGELFNITQQQEGARFLGDSPFFHRVDGLAIAPTPLIDGLPFSSKRIGAERAAYRTYAGSPVRLTEAGQAARAGRFDHARENNIDRWLGGTHLTQKTMWRRDQNGRPVLAA